MSGGRMCTCTRPVNQHGVWRVVQLRCNHSKFNGSRQTPSAYSEIVCLICGRGWRTKAAYVDALRQLEPGELENSFARKVGLL